MILASMLVPRFNALPMAWGFQPPLWRPQLCRLRRWGT